MPTSIIRQFRARKVASTHIYVLMTMKSRLPAIFSQEQSLMGRRYAVQAPLRQLHLTAESGRSRHPYRGPARRPCPNTGLAAMYCSTKASDGSTLVGLDEDQVSRSEASAIPLRSREIRRASRRFRCPAWSFVQPAPHQRPLISPSIRPRLQQPSS